MSEGQISISLSENYSKLCAGYDKLQPCTQELNVSWNILQVVILGAFCKMAESDVNGQGT